MIGARVLGIYTVIKSIGEGGMGAVYLATSNTGHKVVIKVLHPEYTQHATVMVRFLEEAKTAATVQHPNVIKMLGSGVLEDGRAFLAMEWLDGKTLTDHARSWGKLTAADALPIMVQLCDGMQAAHAQGIVHRDMKPDNVFVCNEPRGLIKILDFGISKRLGRPDGNGSPLTASGAIMGTPWYMAPEQGRSAADALPVSDIFAVGVIAFELLAGVRPYRSDKTDGDGLATYIERCTRIALGAEPRPSLAASTAGRDDIPADWIRTIDGAIDVSPDARPQTIREFIEPLYRSLPGGEEIARQLAPGLFTLASPADRTHRAVRGDGTRPGPSTAPHALVRVTTFQGASGQVTAAPVAPRFGRGALAISGAVLVVGLAVVIAVVATSSAPSSPTTAPERDAGAAVDLGTASAETIDASQAQAPQDATTAPDSASTIDASAKRPHRKTTRSPDDID